MLGYEVTKQVLDGRCAQTVIALREAFDSVNVINAWLANNPDVDNVDPLTADPYNYTTDEAYVIRLFFQNLDAVGDANADNFATGRKMTGLS
jgi:hypothetical protein